ncbi:MAG: hypothetical protein J7639_08575 [Paenibacillaceae bacterium]|nr:hypothetical protein [Paenibacillaceae bacterium]
MFSLAISPKMGGIGEIASENTGYFVSKAPFGGSLGEISHFSLAIFAGPPEMARISHFLWPIFRGAYTVQKILAKRRGRLAGNGNEINIPISQWRKEGSAAP